MSNQDVIDLDSSDDECEPSRAPKAVAKKPQKRPMLNAMVHIPSGRGSSRTPKLGIPINNATGLPKIGSVTVKSNKNLGLINGSKLPNVTIKPIKRTPQITGCQPTSIPIGPVRNTFSKNVNGTAPIVSKINKTPLHITNKYLDKSPLKIRPGASKIGPGPSKIGPGPSKIGPGPSNVQCPSLTKIMQNIDPQIKMALESKMTPQQKLALQQKKTPHRGTFKLPPGITVKNVATKSTQPVQLKRPATVTRPSPVPVPKKVRRERPKPMTVETVELDDDDEPDNPSSSSVQWYVRPEDEIKTQNEEDPEATNIFEITIEDSPIKLIHNKRTCEVEKEISISIDDSPVKPPDENGNDNRADVSDDEPPKLPKTPNSRKKLKYAHATKPQGYDEKTIEIEIEPFSSDPLSDNVREKHQEEQEHLIIEIQESPIRKKRKRSPDVTPKKSRPAVAEKPVIKDKPVIADKPAIKSNEKAILLDDDDYKDIGPVYKSFIELCFKMDDTEDMKKIVDKKVKSYYLQVPKDYTESEEFIELVSGKMDLMKASPDKMFLYIKDVVDELNIQRKLAKMPEQKKKEKEKEKEVPEPPIDSEDSEQDVKRRRQIRKLEKTLKKLHRTINKLEEQEVDFDDDGDSVFILTERYKERLIRVHAKLCQLSNVKMPSEPRVSLDARPGKAMGPIKRLERWINRRVPMGTPLPFPDFHDVLRCVKEANREDDLRWNDADIMEEARDLFTRCGRKLQRRRQENEWRVAASRLTGEADPAELSDELKRKLDNNRRAALSKETDLINKYADRQKLLKLEAVEIGDQEAEESPVESEDEAHDDGDDDAKIENSQERKERLKRLLKKKSKDRDCNKKYKEQRNYAAEVDVIASDVPPVTRPPKDDIEVAEVEPDKNNKTTHSKTKEDMAKEYVMYVDVSEKENNTNVDKSDTTEKNIEIGKDKSVNTIVDGQDKSKETIEDDKDKSLNTKDRQKSVETLSDDDSQKIGSDIDEHHLLQKLHSNSLESSDSESFIAISDSTESDDDKDKPNSSDVVSIENSSSESEQDKQVDDRDEVEEIQVEANTEEKEKQVAVKKDVNDKFKTTKSCFRTRDKTSEYRGTLGPVLLGSSCESSNESTELQYQNDTEEDDNTDKSKKLQNQKDGNSNEPTELQSQNDTEEDDNTNESTKLQNQTDDISNESTKLQNQNDAEKDDSTNKSKDLKNQHVTVEDDNTNKSTKLQNQTDDISNESTKLQNQNDAENDHSTNKSKDLKNQHVTVEDDNTNESTKLQNQTDDISNESTELQHQNDEKDNSTNKSTDLSNQHDTVEDDNTNESTKLQNQTDENSNESTELQNQNDAENDDNNSNKSTELQNQNDTEEHDIYTNLNDDALSIGDTIVEEAKESTNKEVAKKDSSNKSDIIKNKNLKVVESSANCQLEKKINTPESKVNDYLQPDVADSPIDCDLDSESNKAKSTQKTDFSEATIITSKKHKKVKSSFDCQIEKKTKTTEVGKANDSMQPEIVADSPIDCDIDSDSNEANVTDKTEFTEAAVSISKKLDEVDSSVDCQIEKEINTTVVNANDPIQTKMVADSPLDCDIDSEANEAKSTDKTEFSEAAMITSENGETSAPIELSNAAIDVNITSKDTELENPSKETEVENPSKVKNME